MNQQTRTSDGLECSYKTEAAKSFGHVNFGDAVWGDARRTRRLVRIADAFVRHPGGSLPEKLGSPAELDALYHLMQCEDVTQQSVLASHVALTQRRIAMHDGYVLALHDTSELDFSTHPSLDDRGQIGNGSHQGWLCHNTLIVEATRREVLGLANQILHARPLTDKNESVAEKREREDRESLLWMQGAKSLPTDANIVDVCDRAADTFEFLEYEAGCGRTFVIRSSHDRSMHAGLSTEDPKMLLHAFARSLPSFGQWTKTIPAAKQKQTVRRKVAGQQTSRSVTIDRKQRNAVLHVSAAPILLCAPLRRRGRHGMTPLPMWVVRVWEVDTPAGVEPLEWILLTNHPSEVFESAQQVKTWYECRWIIEEYHKGQQTGCGIEAPQFTTSARLHPMIAILSLVQAMTVVDQILPSAVKCQCRREVGSGSISGYPIDHARCRPSSVRVRICQSVAFRQWPDQPTCADGSIDCHSGRGERSE